MALHDDQRAMKQKRRMDEYARNDALEIDNAIANLLERRDGRRFLWWLLQTGGVGRQPFSRDPYQTAFECGQLNVGNAIMARIIEAAPEGYLLMQQENASDYRDRTAAINADEPDPRSGRSGSDGAYDNDDYNDGASD